jgi:hypothetical protein
MYLLAISFAFPQPDQASGDLHFYTLPSLLMHKHRPQFCALNADDTTHNDAGARLACHGCLTLPVSCVISAITQQL